MAAVVLPNRLNDLSYILSGQRTLEDLPLSVVIAAVHTGKIGIILLYL